MPASRSTGVAVGEPSSERQRLFLAWLPDAATQERLAALQELLRPRLPRRDYRWVPAQQLHLTLRYFGAVDATLVAELRQRLPLLAASAPAVAAHVAGWRFWPSSQSPRVLVLRVESRGALERLAAAIEELVGGIGFAPEPRRFRAHVTLARAAAGAAPMRPLVEPPPSVPLAIDMLALVGSTLRPEGALHQVLERWPLGAGA